METITTLTVEGTSARLDHYIAEHLPDLSRAAAQRLIEEGFVLVNNVPRKASYKVQAGETITVRVPPAEPATPRAENIPLDILYEDADLIVVNKSAAMIVHPAAGHREGTLVNALLAHCPNLNVGGVERPGIVHRLDSETSGAMVVAKNDAAMRDLQTQFKSRRVKKTYLALVEGIVKPPRGKIDAPIGRDPKHRQKMAVVTQGKTRASVTLYRTLANLGSTRSHPERSEAKSKDAGKYTLVEAQPQTGRTHQIRVHLAFLGFPIVADALYGKRKNAFGLTRQFLHAWKLEFTLPRENRVMQFTAHMPDDLDQALRDVGFDLKDLQ
ncbi:Ribosomal large subunit pseudouridine synthase D [Anaerolineae bacterium]|nr:Ribosomal large subunit pseudouridine synthase D [Anaerolineae bacterium]